MANYNFILCGFCPSLGIVLLCVCGVSCEYPAEEEIFHSDKQTKLGWKSEPTKEWDEVSLRVHSGARVPVLQACRRRVFRSVLSQWMERRDAHLLLMDVSFAQEQEESGEPSPLYVHVFDSDMPISGFRPGGAGLGLRTTRPFPPTTPNEDELSYLNVSRAVDLGPIRHRGFQLAFTYSGTCMLVTAIRLYYRKCSDITEQLTTFKGVGSGSGPVLGTCVQGAKAVSPPFRECTVGGAWGHIQGACTCEPGYQGTNNTCTVCGRGFYRPANESGAGCRQCPPNSHTHKDGSEMCECVPGFNRLSTDAAHLGCTKTPSAPLNVSIVRIHDSDLLLTWDPPLDRGGRQEVTYDIICDQAAGHQWTPCENKVLFLPASVGLNQTSVRISGLDSKCNYRLTVRARNDLSEQQGVPPAATMTITLHGWNDVDASVSSTVNPLAVTVLPQQIHGSWLWLIVGGLLLALIPPITLLAIRQKNIKIRSEQDVSHFPMNAERSWRRLEEADPGPPQIQTFSGGLEMMDFFTDRLKNRAVDKNRITLGKVLGKGEFGSVYEGIFSPSERVNMKVAIKTITVGIDSRAELLEFLKEAEIMKNFNHENVLRLLGVSVRMESDSSLPVPLLILPYMKHGDLRRFLITSREDARTVLSAQTLLRFIVDICAGMDYLSANGILHRDLAARNCMLDDDLRVSVADFGLSKRVYSKNYYRQQVLIRLPIKWMSMESLSESVYSSKSDVWSFGVTMWEILSKGKTPYPGVQNHELLDLLRSGFRLKPPEECDHRLYEVMRSCWDKDPRARPDFSKLFHTLRRFLLDQEEGEKRDDREQEVYMNLHAAPHTPRGENVYLFSPGGAAPEWVEGDDLEDGYMKCIREDT